MTLTNKLYEAASFATSMCDVTIARLEVQFAKEEDQERLMTMNKRQLHKELVKQERELVTLANWGSSIPMEQHNEMVARQKLIRFLIHPSSTKGDISLRA